MPPLLLQVPQVSKRTPDGLVEIDTSDLGCALGRAPRSRRVVRRLTRLRAARDGACRLLGAGAHGIVRSGRLLKTNDPVAVKISAASSAFAASLKELTVLTVLPEHPNVVRTHSAQVSVSDGQVYVVLELCSGGELFDKIAEYGGLPEAEAAHYFAQILAAVAHCHEHSVYHRDLKPENILLDGAGTVKVTDFGLAALSEQEPSRRGAYLRHTRCGSVAYAAPEIYASEDAALGSPRAADAAGSSGYSPEKADIWSLGVVLYCMLTATMPFKIAHVDACERFCAAQAQGIGVLCPDWLSAAAVQLLSRLLAADPAKRPSARELLADAWVRAGCRPVDEVGGEEVIAASPALPKWSAMDRITRPPSSTQFIASDGGPPRKRAHTSAPLAGAPVAAADTWEVLAMPTTPVAAGEAADAAPAAAPASSDASVAKRHARASVGDLVRHLGWERMRGSAIDLMASIVESLGALHAARCSPSRAARNPLHARAAPLAPARRPAGCRVRGGPQHRDGRARARGRTSPCALNRSGAGGRARGRGRGPADARAGQHPAAAVEARERPVWLAAARPRLCACGRQHAPLPLAVQRLPRADGR